MVDFYYFWREVARYVYTRYNWRQSHPGAVEPYDNRCSTCRYLFPGHNIPCAHKV